METGSDRRTIPMIYINQLERAHIHFEHNLDNGGAGDHSNIASSGCGPCSLCMVINNMTMETPSLEDCIQMVYEADANREPGTDMRRLGPLAAERYNLDYRETDSIGELIAHLQNGGMAIANVGGDRDGHIGVFSHGGHYIAVTAFVNGEMCILDPSWKEGKFSEEGRQGLVREMLPYLYCAPEVLMRDTENRTPGYYLFSRKCGQ